MQVAKLPLARTLPAKGKTSYTEDMIMASLMAWCVCVRVCTLGLRTAANVAEKCPIAVAFPCHGFGSSSP